MTVIESTDSSANTPKTRRAVLLAALGGAVASAVALVRPPVTAAVDPNDVVLDGTNAGVGTTEINATSSNPAVRVLGGGTGVVAWSQTDGTGLVGRSTNGTAADPTVSAKTGVQGIAEQDGTSRGVYGLAAAGQGVRGVATSGVGVAAVADAGTALDAQSNSGDAIHAGANSTATGVLATAVSGHAVRGTSSAGHAIRGRGALDGVIGESTGGRSGVVGYSGGGSAAAPGPAKVGVYGEATQDTASRGVSGFTIAGQGVRGQATTGQGVAGVADTGQGVRGSAVGGQGVLGEDTTGVGVRAVATTGLALDVTGRARFSRSGRATIPINRSYVDVTVSGAMASTAFALAVLQVAHSGVWVTAARINYPTAGKIRIYLNKVASTSVTTPVGWAVFG